ncbi:hypothetical protein ACA910_006128 [Epithemia clementina (nom. ined.)]
MNASIVGGGGGDCGGKAAAASNGGGLVPSTMALSSSLSSSSSSVASHSSARWSGLETPGMKDARCSLLLQEEISYDARIKVLPKQRVLVCQDKGFATTSALPNGGSNSSSSNSRHNRHNNHHADSNFYVEFPGTTILQLEPAMVGQHKTMPVTLTVGGRCTFTADNYQDFRVMMRTKAQSRDMDLAPNGNFDWPDVAALLLCPCCGRQGPVPQPGSPKRYEYWMVFYPLLQITLLKGTQMTLGTRTICRFLCLDCMEDLLEGLTLRIQPGGTSRDDNGRTRGRLAFTLPAADVLAEAGSASFLEDAPPRPDHHHNHHHHHSLTGYNDELMDAWTLYNLWEHTGTWEALQNDYRLVLSRSMHPDQNHSSATNNQNGTNDPGGDPQGTHGARGTVGGPSSSPHPAAANHALDDPRWRDRIGKPCGYAACGKLHGSFDAETGLVIRLAIKCRDCWSEYYCSRACREAHAPQHAAACRDQQHERQERRREKKAKRVQCDTCHIRFPYTKMKKCSRCRRATYCSVECQKGDWEVHKKICTKAYVI